MTSNTDHQYSSNNNNETSDPSHSITHVHRYRGCVCARQWLCVCSFSLIYCHILYNAPLFIAAVQWRRRPKAINNRSCDLCAQTKTTKL